MLEEGLNTREELKRDKNVLLPQYLKSAEKVIITTLVISRPKFDFLMN